ncbi:hypothetical protein NQ318_000407 [Aromia moschata]|uniref:Uncharacterized protein n=1 Tax=Aromia moschata TaxID=1265417 RepID=A0AAV8YW80_9CUCU|nr:hypothetical protein NQ318_000407 [Aromia moschata]
MSRLNPKAPEYSSYSMQNKPSPHIYNGYQMNSQNNIYMSKQCNVDNYHRSSMNSSQNRLWMQVQPPFTQQQSEQLISGIAGMTLHNIAKFTGNEVLENGANWVSSTTRPICRLICRRHTTYTRTSRITWRTGSHHNPSGAGRKDDSNPSIENWRLNDKTDKWSLGNNADFSIRNPQLYGEDLLPMDYTRPIPALDTSHFINGPQYFNHQPPLNTVRHDFMQDISKLDLSSWDNATRPIPSFKINSIVKRFSDVEKRGLAGEL